jgi:8-oxo-dGTP pyrophosphatase MutT (NUDIX family)
MNGVSESAPPADAVVARPAATVVLLRDGARGGVEVHLQQRRAEMDFGGSAYVFPGGSVDAGDEADETLVPLAGIDLGANAARMHLDGDAAALRLCAALHVCAVREVFEEAGLLLAVGAGVMAEPDAGTLEAARLRVQRGASFGAELAALGRRPHMEALRYVAHFITPVGSPRRFDTRFFATRAPAGQVDAFHAAEAQLGGWFAPAEVLARQGRGDVFLMPPTQIMLAELSHHRDVDSVLGALGARPVAAILFSWRDLGMPLPDHLPGADEFVSLGGEL